VFFYFFVCTYIVQLPPGESPIAASGDGGGGGGSGSSSSTSTSSSNDNIFKIFCIFIFS
jgi:hypothetical protein